MLNNPLRYQDSTGHWPEEPELLAGVARGAIVQFIDDYSQGQFSAHMLRTDLAEVEVEGFQLGREVGRAVTQAIASYEMANGIGMAIAGIASLSGTAGGGAACTALTGGGCAPFAGVAVGVSIAEAGVGVAATLQGASTLLYAKNHPVERMGDVQKHGRPSKNYDQNPQANAAIRSYERQTGQTLSKDQRQVLHKSLREAENPGYDDIVDMLYDLFGGE